MTSLKNMENWVERNQKYTLQDAEDNFAINFAGMKFTDAELQDLAGKFELVNAEMAKIEAGAIKNPDENRKVTHFTDRAGYVESTLFGAV